MFVGVGGDILNLSKRWLERSVAPWGPVPCGAFHSQPEDRNVPSVSSLHTRTYTFMAKKIVTFNEQIIAPASFLPSIFLMC